jgi:hypothetical protein
MERLNFGRPWKMPRSRDVSLSPGNCIIKLNNYNGLDECYYFGQFINLAANHAAANNWLYVTKDRDSAAKVDKEAAQKWAASHFFYKPEII